MNSEKHEGQHLTPGYTPAYDFLIQKYDLTTSAVYGRIWRYAQGDRGQCDAALGTIARELKLNRATVWRKIQLLKEGGYVGFVSGKLKGAPNIYRITGKAEKEAEKYRAQKLTGVAQSDTQITEGIAENDTPYAESYRGLAQSNRGSCTEQHKETIKKQIKNTIKENGDDDHQNCSPSSPLLGDGFDKVKTAWLEVVGKMSASHERKLIKHVEEFSSATVLGAIEKMGDYAETPNPAYLKKVLASLTKKPQGKYNSGKFAEFIE